MVRRAADILADIESGETQPAAPADIATILRWEDPPPRDARGRTAYPPPDSKYADLADELRARPGEWALIYNGDKTRATHLATTIRLGQIPVFARDFDAVTRTIAGRTRTYARYIGDQG
jgi:hypothetical protein